MTWTDESRFLYAYRFADRYREVKMKLISNEKTQPDTWRAPIDIRRLAIVIAMTVVIGVFLIKLAKIAVRWFA